MKTPKISHRIIGFIVLVAAVVALICIFKGDVTAPKTVDKSQKPSLVSEQKIKNGFKVFNGVEFEQLYNSFAYPNTQKINEETPISGNLKADKKLRELAVARGYILRSAPVTDTFVEVQKGMLLQQRASQPWLDMKNGAKKDGLELSLSAAYRSADDEKIIFLDLIKNISLDFIAQGKADTQVNAVLDHVALPGYSRHHTGYTVDIACDSQSGVKFEQSVCFKWLSKNNYLNAKTFGWIPSYPSGAGKQGPEPESWEYVWVGIEVLK